MIRNARRRSLIYDVCWTLVWFCTWGLCLFMVARQDWPPYTVYVCIMLASSVYCHGAWIRSHREYRRMLTRVDK